jgi:hypothetical protein
MTGSGPGGEPTSSFRAAATGPIGSTAPCAAAASSQDGRISDALAVNCGDNPQPRIAKGRRKAPSMCMATARQANELRRWADLTVIHGAFEGRMPEALPGDSGLKDVAELCKRDYAARPGRDWNDVRDQLLLIGIEWDLARDRLDQQSPACLRAIAAFLR